MRCDFCGEPVKHSTVQPVRMGSMRSAVTFDQIGVDVSWEAIGKGVPAQLHEECQETMMAKFFIMIIDKVRTS